MTDAPDPHLVATPATAAGTKAFVVTPFARLARTHAAGTVADAMVAASLAGSLFFSLPAGDARGPVLQYLLITMMPFSVLSPLIGPLIDRLKGGHRFVVLGAAVLRCVLAYLLIGQIKGAGTMFFLLALCLLVCQKAYQVARSALVPSVVRSDRELVEANSKLSLLSGLSSFAGAVPAAGLMQLFGPEWSLGLAATTYAVAAVLAAQLQPSRVATTPAGEAEKVELRGAGIVLAGSAMGVLRWCVGFLTLLVAFDFKGESGVTWQLGVVGAASVLSQLAGAAVAPRLRDLTKEENLLSGSLVTVLVGALLAMVVGNVMGAAVLGASVGFSAAVGKLAFDSILQRDAPDANRGRAFARFETRFQVMWVIGALIPVWLTMEIGVGFLAVAGMALFALASYSIGRMAWAHRTGVRQTAATAAALGIEERFAGVSGEVKGRVGRVGRRALRRKPTDDVDDEDLDDDVRHDLDDHLDHGGHPDGELDHHPLGEQHAAGVDHAGWAEAPTAAASEVDPRSGPSTVPFEAPHPGAPAAGAEGPTRVLVGPTAGASETDRPLTHDPDPELGDDPESWPEPQWADSSEFPWEPPTRRTESNRAYLADVPPTVDNPYPWTPDPTDPEGRPDR